MDSTSVLLVDDSELARFALADYLEQAGLRVLQACDGEQGLAIVRNEPQLRMVITDIKMPNLNGFELARGIRLLVGKCMLPIVAFTGLPITDALSRSVFDQVLMKPLTPPEVFAAIAPLLQPALTLAEARCL